MLTEMFAQGDLLLDRVPDVSPSGTGRKKPKGRPRCSQKDRHAKSPRLFHRRT